MRSDNDDDDDGDDDYNILTLAICLKSNVCGKVSALNFLGLASIVHQNWSPFIYHYFCDVEASHIKSLVLSIAKRKLAKPIVVLAELKSYNG